MRAKAEPAVRSIGTDPAAFGEFYRAHVDEVTRFVTRRVADPQLAADLTADVFLAVIDAAADYRGSFGGPRTWLFGIARNVIAAEAAAALGIRPVTARVRMHRARQALRSARFPLLIETEVA
jgi:RNA polymerase sigma-70 factor, ECF subfamily